MKQRRQRTTQRYPTPSCSSLVQPKKTVCSSPLPKTLGPQRACAYSAEVADESPVSIRVHTDAPPTRSSSYREIETTPGRLKVSYPRHAPAKGFLTLFAFIWNFSVGTALVIDFGGFVRAAFPLIHLTLGIGLLWYVLAAWLNRNVVAIEDGMLSCTEKGLPMPFRKAQSVALTSVASFRVEQREVARMNDKPLYAYFVLARGQYGKETQVSDALATHAEADFLKQRFEEHRSPKAREHLDGPARASAVRVEEAEDDELDLVQDSDTAGSKGFG